MELYDAIYRRKATRKYSGEPLKEETLAHIAETAGNAELLYDTDLRIHVAREGKKVYDSMKSLVGNLDRVMAPHYLVIISEEKPGYGENAGYAGEQVVLEMTRMGLATCWLEGNPDRKAVKDLPAAGESRAPVVFVAFGNPQKEGDQYRNDPKDAKRMELSQIVTGNADGKWTRLLDAARLAPSTGNSQPWRFFVEGDKADLYIAKGNLVAQRFFGKLNYVDAGIALCHVAVAAKHFSMPLNIGKMPAPEREDYTYITSISIVRH